MDFSEGGPISRMSVTDVLERQGRGDENYRWFVEVTNLADRVVLQVADARDDVQKRTFTKWVNSHLKKHPSKQLTLVHDLYKDLRDGSRLIPLLEILTGERIPQERGKLRLHRLQNVRKALDVLKVKKVALVNIDNVDIVDGNTKLTLGLIWTIILHFQISDVKIEGQHLQPKDALLQWAKQTVDGVPGVHVTDFERSWRDGLAFNAIIYRNRPDLVDFPSLRPSEHKKNLRHAFTVAEKHLGVTSLLEPEDVDVPKPDERSIMTYVSSLYDVFPTVPPKQTKTSTITTTLKTSRQTGPAVTSHVQETVIHSSGSQNSSSAASSASAAGTDPQWEVYAQPARQMMDWAKRTANMMDDRSIPQSTAEIKRALADLSRFKSEELPTKEAEKQRLASRFREVERSTQATGQFRPPAGLHINNLESAFDSCRLAIQQREHILNSELHRMEQQDTLANKVSRQIPMVSADLDTIQARIHDAEGKADKMTAVDVRNTIDDIESASRTCDKNIAILMREVAQLRTNNHPSGPELDRKLKQLQDRLATLRNFQIAGTTQKVTTRTMVQGDAVKLERRVELRTERRFVEGNVDQFIQDCYKWVKNKESSLKVASYGDDLEKVQKALQQSKGELHTIREYERNISKCRSVLSNMTGEELQRNQEQIAIVEDAYKQLLDMAVKRVRDLEILLEFVQMATKEMMWMNQLEDEHANRDWSAKNLNIAELEKHYKTLMREIQGRERQFTSVQNHGERLMMENHPAKPCISDHLSAMQSQWNTVTQLANSLETHLKYAAEYFQDPEAALDADQTVRPVQSADLSSALMSKVKQLGDREPEDGQVVSTEAEPTKKDANPGKLEEPLVNPDKPGNPHPRSGNPHPANPQPGNPHPGNPKSTSGKSHENPDPNLGNPNPKPGNPHPENPGRDNPKERNPRPGVGNPHPDNPKPHNPKDQGEGSEIPGDSITTRTEYTVTSTTRRFAPFPKGQEVEVYPKAETEKQPHSQTSSSAASDPYRTASWRPLGEGPPSRGEVGPPGFAFQTFTKSGEASPLSYKPPPIASPELVMWRVKRLLSAEVPVSYLSPSEKRLTTFFAPDTSASPSDSVLTWVS